MEQGYKSSKNALAHTVASPNPMNSWTLEYVPLAKGHQGLIKFVFKMLCITH